MNKLFIFSLLPVLLFPVDLFAAEIKVDASSDVKALEERIMKLERQSLGNTYEIQNDKNVIAKEAEIRDKVLKGIEEMTIKEVDNLKRIIEIRSSEIDKRILLYFGLGTVLLGFLSLLGKETLKHWIKDIIKNRVDEILTEEGLKKLVEEKIGAPIQVLIDERNKSVDNYKRILEDLENKGQEIQEMLAAEKTLSIENASVLDEFSKSLGSSKKEVDYTAEDWLFKGLNSLKKSNLKEALADYTKAIEVNPGYVMAYNNRGNIYVKQDKYDEALADYTKAIELDPEYAMIYCNRGNIYVKQDKYDEALADYTKSIELDPEYTNAYSNRGVIYDKQDKDDEALADYTKAIELDPESAIIYSNRGHIYDKRDKYDEALADYIKAIELDPESAMAYNNRGIMYAKEDKYDEALADYNKAIELDPEYTNGYNNRGGLYIKRLHYEAGVSDHLKVFNLGNVDPIMFLNLSESYLFVKRYGDSIDVSNRVLTMTEDINVQVLAYYLKCIAKRLKGEEIRDTEAEFENALKEDIKISWNVSDMKVWQEGADISDEDKKYITELSDKIRAKR